jgi:hypothetical protein
MFEWDEQDYGFCDYDEIGLVCPDTEDDDVEMYDRHAAARDKKSEKRAMMRRMRGNRSVFEIEKAVVSRAAKLTVVK